MARHEDEGHGLEPERKADEEHPDADAVDAAAAAAEGRTFKLGNGVLEPARDGRHGEELVATPTLTNYSRARRLSSVVAHGLLGGLARSSAESPRPGDPPSPCFPRRSAVREVERGR